MSESKLQDRYLDLLLEMVFEEQEEKEVQRLAQSPDPELTEEESNQAKRILEKAFQETDDHKKAEAGHKHTKKGKKLLKGLLSIAAILLLLSSIGMAASAEFREAFLRMFIRVNEQSNSVWIYPDEETARQNDKYFSDSIKPPQQWTGSFYLSSVPQGFALDKESVRPQSVRYTNGQQAFTFAEHFNASENERSLTGLDYVLSGEKENAFDCARFAAWEDKQVLAWDDGFSWFELIGEKMEREELISIANAVLPLRRGSITQAKKETDISIAVPPLWGGEWFPVFLPSGLHIVSFSHNIKPDSCVHDGVLRIARELTKEEQKSHPSGWGIVYGLGKPDGTVVVEPKYDHLEFAGEGLVSTYLDGKCGVIDLTGREIVPPQYQISTGGKLPMIVYWNGYTEIDDAQAGKSLILDEKGEEIYSIPRQSMISSTDDTRYYTLTSPYKNGCFWVHSWTVNRENDMIRQENTNYQLMKIVDGQAISLNDEYYSDITPWIEAACDQTEENFAEGLQAVCQNSLWGFIDENGLPSRPFQWNAACNFHNGLALVEKDGKLAYIDHNSTVIWREP